MTFKDFHTEINEHLMSRGHRPATLTWARDAHRALGASRAIDAAELLISIREEDPEAAADIEYIGRRLTAADVAALEANGSL